MPKPRQPAKRRVKPVLTKQRLVATEKLCKEALSDFWGLYELWEMETDSDNRENVLQVYSVHMLTQAAIYVNHCRQLSSLSLPLMGHSTVRDEREAFLRACVDNLADITQVLKTTPGVSHNDLKLEAWLEAYEEERASNPP